MLIGKDLHIAHKLLFLFKLEQFKKQIRYLDTPEDHKHLLNTLLNYYRHLYTNSHDSIANMTRVNNVPTIGKRLLFNYYRELNSSFNNKDEDFDTYEITSSFFSLLEGRQRLTYDEFVEFNRAFLKELEYQMLRDIKDLSLYSSKEYEKLIPSIEEIISYHKDDFDYIEYDIEFI